MLYINNLTKRYGTFTALNGLNLHIPEGDLFGFVGPNGAGKTTTIRIVCGLLQANSGQVTIDGVDAFAYRQHIKKKIGYVPDFFGVYDNLKVTEYMEFYGTLNGMDSASVRKISRDLLALVNLSDKEDVYVDGLSRGMKQRLCVARALIHNPKLLILDEPSSGLDPMARIEMKELLMNLNSMGKTIIISSHILSELSEMCNSIGIMNKGNLVAAGKIESIMNQVSGGTKYIISVAENMDLAVRIAQENPRIKVDSVRENEIHVIYNADDREVSQFIGYMISQNVILTGFKKEDRNLETLFMQVAGGVMNEN